MPFFPALLRIPMRFEKELISAWDNHDYKRIRDAFENFSLNGDEGPGYTGYLFYNIYEINLIIFQYNVLSSELNLYGREYLKRNHVKNLRFLRKSFVRLFSIQERRFMKKYGLSDEWLRIKILGRTPSSKIENYYYKVLIDDINSSLDIGVKRNDPVLIREVVSKTIKLGIELSLILGWFLFYIVYTYSILKRIMDVDEIIDHLIERGFKEGVVKILHHLSEYYSISLIKILKFLPHRLHLISLNAYGSIKKEESHMIWLGVIERCWVRIFTIHLNKSGLIEGNDSSLLCKVCLMSWDAVYNNVSSNFEKIIIDNIQKDKGMCYLSIKAYYITDKNDLREHLVSRGGDIKESEELGE